MNDIPLLSIITATYNRAQTLGDCFASVHLLFNEIHNIEHVIIDNNSSDGTNAIVKEYIKGSPYKVKYIREADRGIYYALNKGIAAASGTYIHLLHSDDRYSTPFDISPILLDMKEGIADVIACSVRMKNSATKYEKIWEPRFGKRFCEFLFPHTGCIIKASFYRRQGFYDTRFKIISDALYIANNFPAATISIRDNILVEMATTGISGRESLRYYLEKMALILLSKNYPLYYKIKRLPIIIKKTMKFLIKICFKKDIAFFNK